jgi:hypothetical protein
MNVTFDFLRENLKPLLKFSLYVILPLCLLQSFFMDSFMRVYISALGGNSGGSTAQFFAIAGYYGVLIVCALLGSILISALVYSLLHTYEQRDRRLQGLAFADIKPLFMANCAKALRIMLFNCGLIIAAATFVAVLAWFSLWTLIGTFLLLIIGTVVFMVPLTLFTPLYLFEDLPFGAALRKSMKYGFSAWGEIFLVSLVFGLLANILSGVTSLPWTLVTIIGSIFSIASPDAGIETSLWYRFLTYILGVIMAYGTYLGLIVTTGGIAFQYFHLREKREGVTMQTDIVNFDSL